MGDRFPQWLMDSTAAIERMPKPRLVELAQKADPDSAMDGLTKAQLVDLIKRRREAHWDNTSSEIRRGADRLDVDRVVRVGDRGYIIPAGIISAREVNEFLCSLPPLDPDAPQSCAHR